MPIALPSPDRLDTSTDFLSSPCTTVGPSSSTRAMRNEVVESVERRERVAACRRVSPRVAF